MSFASLRLKLTDQERDDLLFNLVIQNRRLAEVNTFLVCGVLSKLGLSVEEIDAQMSAAHELVWTGVEDLLAGHLDVDDQVSDLLRDDPQGDDLDGPDTESP